MRGLGREGWGGKVESGVGHSSSLCGIAATVNRAELLSHGMKSFPLSLNFFLEGLLLDDFERGGDSGLVQGTHHQRFQ